MLRVVIADDEPKVNLLLQKIVNWEALGFEIVGTAQDGIHALKFIRKEKPDLVMTDIRMPGCDGMELIRQAKEVKPDILFIVVSGYRQFEYARTALKYGVEDYLLKPVKADELTRLLKNIYEKKSEQIKMEEWKENINQKMQKDTQRNRERLIGTLVSGKERQIDFPDRNTVNQEFGCQFEEGIYQVILITPNLPQVQEKLDTYKIMMKRALTIVEKYMKEFSREAVAAIKNEGIFLIVQCESYDSVLVKKYLTKIRKEIENQRDLFWGIRVSITAGKCRKSIQELPEAVREVVRWGKDRILPGKGEWIEVGEMESISQEVEYQMPASLRKSFYEMGEYLDYGKYCRELEKLEKEICSSAKLSGQMVYECFVETVEACLSGLKQNEKINEEEIKQELICRYHMCSSLADVFSLLRDDIGKVFKNCIELKEKKEMRPITEAKNYIQEHYKESLKLEEVSRVIGFNATYFSTVFKKETGKSFLDYLTEVRMSKAKQLLCRGDLSVNDVAEEVGYQDLKYFSKLFKKATGISPSEYKKLYQ